MILRRQAKPTLTPFHLDHGDTLDFTLSSGRVWEMTLHSTRAEITARTAFGGAARDPMVKQGEIAAYAFAAEVSVNGRRHTIRREVGTQASFAEPFLIEGVEVWLDAVSCIFDSQGGFLGEKDWRLGYLCEPARHARFAVQEEGRGICPEPVLPWYPGAPGGIDIRDCYNGEDCWMGPYSGGAAHCGLDINMKAGTVLSAPIHFDQHYLFHSLASGFNNNRWRGVRRWPDGSQWWLQCHHQVDLLAPEGGPLAAGTPYATGAGVAIGSHEHSHFLFGITEQGGDYLLDPWLLFREMGRRR